MNPKVSHQGDRSGGKTYRAVGADSRGGESTSKEEKAVFKYLRKSKHFSTYIICANLLEGKEEKEIWTNR